MNYEIVEFIVNNREQINAHITMELQPSIKAARIFEGHDYLQNAFLTHQRVKILRSYIEHNFNLDPEELMFIDQELLEFLKEI